MPKGQTSSAEDPGTETDIPSVDSKLAQLDDDLNPIDPKNDPLAKDEPEDDDADTEPVDDNPDDVTDTDEPKDDEPDEEPDKPKDDKDEPEGYTIDEGIEETEPETPVETTPEDKFILDGIKDSALTVRGTVGDSKEIKEYKVLTPQQLPRGFHYIDDYEAGVAFTGFNALEQKAAQLQNQYRLDASNKTTADVIAKEQQADRSDVARMQKAGVIDLFKAQPDDANFESDPAVELVQNVLDFKDKLNNAYNEAYGKGAAYRHIGFEEAYYRYQRENPTKGNTKQTKEDTERKAFAKRTNRPNAGRDKARQPAVPAGASSRDLDRYIESLEL